MSNSGIDALGRVPPSGALGQTLQRSADYARHQSHRRITLEHLLLALCDDPDAARVLAASRVDVRQIMIDASGFVGRIEDRSPPGQPVEPMLDGELARILEYATVAAQQSGRREINGAIVLAAIVGDERSAAATILRSQGLTFDEAISVLRQTARQPGDAPPTQPPPAPLQPPQFQAPQFQPPQLQAGPPQSTAQILADVRTRIEAGTTARMPDWAGASAAPPQSRVQQPPSWTPEPPQSAPPWPAAPPQSYPAEIPQPSYPQYADAPAPQPQAYPYRPEYASTIGTPAYGDRPPSYAAQPPHQPQPPVPAPESEPPGRRTGPPRRGKAQGPPADQQAVLPLTAIDPDQLAMMLPDRITREVPEQIEIRVSRSDIANIGALLGNGPGAARPDLIVSRSLTVRLRSPDGRTTVEPVTPETHWIERDEGYLQSDDVCWRWTVTGRRPGMAALLLTVRARTVAVDGMPVESALPDQSHDVAVSTNWPRLVGRMTAFAIVFLVGAVLAISGTILLDFIAGVSRRP